MQDEEADFSGYFDAVPLSRKDPSIIFNYTPGHIPPEPSESFVIEYKPQYDVEYIID